MSSSHAMTSQATAADIARFSEFAERETGAESLDDLLVRVRDTMAPVWPLKDYVAVNPFLGVSERRFLNARRFLRIFSDCETLMPLSYYAAEYRAGHFSTADIETAIAELREDFFDDPPKITAAEIVRRLQAVATDGEESEDHPNSDRRIRTVSEFLDRFSNSDWTAAIREEIGKHCAAHYDEGQAVWSCPWKHLPLYQSWRSAAVLDRNFEFRGVTGFRKLVASLPHTPEAAIVYLLQWLGVPQRLWESVLLCTAFSIPGWAAWTKYQFEAAERSGQQNDDFAGLLAIRLAYDAALCRPFGFCVDWESVAADGHYTFESLTASPVDDSLLRYTLLRASEIAYRGQLLDSLAKTQTGTLSQTPPEVSRASAQMVFCIDTRSERIRRQIEITAGAEIETFGFAGFFGVPIEYVALGETRGTGQVPALLTPQFRVHETIDGSPTAGEEAAIERRSLMRRARQAWKSFQTAAVSCFTFVETIGVFYLLKLFRRTTGMIPWAPSARFDGVARSDHGSLSPNLAGLEREGVTESRQVELAESILKNLGLTENFARLVVFCGHASQTENNPLQAGLDCGACGGHSGEPNAKFAASLLNQAPVRSQLAKRGIHIPEDTIFVAGLHNTTTDEIAFFGASNLPPSHQQELADLAERTATATAATRTERMPLVQSRTVSDLLWRAKDWSEIRPEWGLAGNAAFIAAPRSATSGVELDGRTFLHSYDCNRDPAGKVLEQIMTAPLVVAHWINMQYYASTVDNRHFGSGTKTVHNVVGQFGIHSGIGGDLTTGLPWESLHNGQSFQHEPLRLLAVIAAPRKMIERVIEKHSVIDNLLTGGWLNLVACEDGSFYRYSQNQSWQCLDSLAAACTTE